jgi:signal transduction histidine kinase/DNA-binding NarL/FixJ family response regulator
MKKLLEVSKQQLLNPLGRARRKLVLILNGTFLVSIPLYLASEKLTNGQFVQENFLWGIYGVAFLANLLSMVLSIGFIGKRFLKGKKSDPLTDRFNNLAGAISLIPILLMSTVNMLGLGNPNSDAILTDFGLGLALMIAVVIILGRRYTIVWALIVLGALIYNVALRGWNYEYHYLTPSEVIQYKKDLGEKKDYALKRQKVLREEHLSPPRISRYFNVWLIFIGVTFLLTYYFSGITHDILKVIPAVVSNIEVVTEESKTIEVERMLNHQKTTTFLNLAHETKTPLTLINNYVEEYIKKNGENEEMRIIKQNIQRLTNDIVNFFDSERFTKGISTYDHNQICDISSILQTKIPLFEAYARGKQLLLKSAIEDGLFIKAHPGAVERIANNLIENAIKYTNPKGTIEVKLFSQGQQLLFTVSDTGVGIPAEFQTKIFEPYYQLSNNRKSNDGIGLGLPIVKQIVADIRGSLVLTSEVNYGTTVTVALVKYVPSVNEKIHPYNVSKELNLLDIDQVIDEPYPVDERKPFLLILEDNRQLLSFMVKNLRENFNVIPATDGKAALHQLEQGLFPDLIISDVMMDGMDGFEFFENIADERFGHIPFIFLTAKTNAEDKLSGLKLGAVDYIEKPFDMQELMTKAESLMSTMAKQEKYIISIAYRNLKQNGSGGHHFGNGAKSKTLDVLKDINMLKEIDSFELRCKNYALTSAEIRVIGEVAKGAPYKIIAETLNISEYTVRKHVENIYKKTNSKNKVELLAKLQSHI